MTRAIRPIVWAGDWAHGVVQMIDQLRLPEEEVLRRYDTVEGVAAAIREMVVRGAPAIGIAAAMGVALAVRDADVEDTAGLIEVVDGACALLATTRPTAVNLFWALERMRRRMIGLSGGGLGEARRALHAESLAILEEDIAANRQMGQNGAALIPDGARFLTHCNAGALATGGYGTALGIVRACHERAVATQGPPIHVWVDETRPYLQGARLTAWECVREGIPATLITDNMAGFFMGQGQIDAIVIGADRVAANGDVANKIGSYSLAVLARYHDVPFYVAAPTSTLDMETPTGAQIVIEERSADEVTQIGSRRIAPREIAVRHPAFDVTPAELITAIITERGVARAPFGPALAALALSSDGSVSS